MKESSALERRFRHLGLFGWSVLFLAYTFVFWAFSPDGSAPAVQRALFNTVPAALLSWPAARLIDHYLIDASLKRMIPAHFILAIGYGFLWYVGLQIGYGLQNGLPEGGIVGRALSGAGLTWQLYQGVTLYAVVALFTYTMIYRLRLEKLTHQLEALSTTQAESRSAPSQIFLKDGKTIRPTALTDIFVLSGAGDYTEVATRDSTLLSTTSLNGFEEELPAATFLRVHRSHIVRLDAVLSMESAGNGRMTLHFPKGLSVTTSRAGAKAVRERAL